MRPAAAPTSSVSHNRGPCRVDSTGVQECDGDADDAWVRHGGVAVEERRRVRELASPARAGRWSRNEALRRQYRFARRNWRGVALTAVTPAVAVPFLWFLPGVARPYVIGGLVATGAALAVFLVVIASGTAPRMMGAWAESWTAQELRLLTRREWKVIHGARAGYGDIDHIAIGPSGIVVLETKWRNDAWDDADGDGRIARASRQLATNARRVRELTKHVAPGAAVYQAVVLWSPEPFQLPASPPRPGQPATVAGTELKTWLDRLDADQVLPHDQVTAAWTKLSDQTKARDDRELADDGPPPKTLHQYYLSFLQVLCGLLLAALATSLIASHVHPEPLLLLATWAVGGILSLGTKHRKIRTVAIAATVAACGVATAITAVAAVLLVSSIVR